MRQQESSSQTLCEPGRNGSAAPASPPLAEPWGAEELAATLDSVGTAIWAVDLEGCCVFINQAACHIFGRTREECLGQKLHCRIHRGHPAGWHCPKHECPIRSALENGSAALVEDDAFFPRDGTPCPANYSVQPVVVQGRIRGAVINVIDVAPQKRAEESLRQNDEWLKFTLNAAGIGLRHRGAEENKVSDQQFRLYGLEPAEKWISRERWLQLIHPEDRERVEIEQSHARNLADPHDIEFRAVWPDGSVHWLLCRGRTFHEGSGAQKIEITIDITERKRLDEARRESERRFRLITETIDDVFWISDPELRKILYVSPAYERIWGRPTDQVYEDPSSFLAAIHPDDGAKVYAGLARMKSGVAFELEFRIVRPDGTVAWIWEQAFPVRDATGKLECYIGIAQDITERKAMEEAIRVHSEKLARSNEELERFAYVASHDLQEPLRMVTSFTQLLANRYSGRLDETADRYIHYAVDGAKRMQQLIADLLAYSRVESKELDLRQIDCGAVVSAALRNLQVAIEESGASIDTGPLPALWADQGQLTQVFQNLLANAIKFRKVEECPRIHISSVDSDGEWTISVQDNGIGIEPQHAERVFRMFQRLHTRDEYPGTGIGLAVCRKVVERLGGKLWVESEPGAGSTFRFTIPKLERNGNRGESAKQTSRDSVD